MEDVPAWLPTIATIIGALAVILRKLGPVLNEHIAALRNSKVDELVFDIVADLSETTGKDIQAAIADGKLTKEEGRELLVELGTNTVTEVIGEVGEHYLGAGTARKVERKVEKIVGALKKRGEVAGAIARRDPPVAPPAHASTR